MIFATLLKVSGLFFNEHNKLGLLFILSMVFSLLGNYKSVQCQQELRDPHKYDKYKPIFRELSNTVCAATVQLS